MTSRWAELAEKARKAGGEVWTAERQDEDDGSIYWAIHSTFDYEFITNAHAPKNANFIAAANPKAILELVAAHNALLEELRTARDALQALEFGAPGDAFHNLGGAIIDIERAPQGWAGEMYECDRVSLKTLKRVEAQLGKASAAKSHPAEPTGWRDIGTAPKEGHVLVYLSKANLGSHIGIARLGGPLVISGMFEWDLEGKPTHWRPLPESPTPPRKD